MAAPIRLRTSARTIHLIACGLALFILTSARAQSPAAPAVDSGLRDRTTPLGPGKPAFRFEDVDDKTIEVLEGSKPVLDYKYGDIEFKQGSRIRRRASYVHPIYGLEGEVLTDNHPSDHLHHHGLFWGWPHTKIGDREYDFWNKEDIGIRFKKWLAKDAGTDGAKLGIENAWVINDKEVAKEEV